MGALALTAAAAIPSHAGDTFLGTPCDNRESWTLGEDFTAEARFALAALTEKRGEAVMAFAEALSVRSRAYASGPRATTEYFISRALYDAKLPHVARAGFRVLLNRPADPETEEVQWAALSCLERIEAQFPTLALPEGSESVIARLQKGKGAEIPERREILARAAFRRGMAVLREADGASVAQALAQLLPPDRAERAVLLSHVALRERDLKAVIASARKALNQPQWPPHLEPERDALKLMLARALYSVGRPEEAVPVFQSVSKSSNLLASSLSDLSWAQLASDQYIGAIGNALSLRTGSMKNTFTPEAPMVMAMSLNELCQFPESLKAMNQFRSDYEAPYQWLREWKKHRSPLYPALLAVLKGHAQVPNRVGTELLRSPIFLSHQEELNLLIDEAAAAKGMARSGAELQRKLGIDLLTHSRELKAALVAFRRKSGEEADLPEKLRLSLGQFRKKVHRYLRVREAAGPWRGIIASHERSLPELRKRLKGGIERDLIQRAERMVARLEEIAENNQLIEIEILNGASQDLVWQNANPDFKKVAREIAESGEKAQRRPAGQTLDWGRSAAWENAENAEIWEDELGSFKTDLIDNCSSKDKYLAIRRTGGN
jgi:hypothetical protein